MIEVRLDRALLTVEFMNMFIHATHTNLEVFISDYCPLFLELYKVYHEVKVQNFHFENAWLIEPMCQKLVIDVWHMIQGRSFYDKLVECA